MTSRRFVSVPGEPVGDDEPLLWFHLTFNRGVEPVRLSKDDPYFVPRQLKRDWVDDRGRQVVSANGRQGGSGAANGRAIDGDDKKLVLALCLNALREPGTALAKADLIASVMLSWGYDPRLAGELQKLKKSASLNGEEDDALNDIRRLWPKLLAHEPYAPWLRSQSETDPILRARLVREARDRVPSSARPYLPFCA